MRGDACWYSQNLVHHILNTFTRHITEFTPTTGNFWHSQNYRSDKIPIKNVCTCGFVYIYDLSRKLVSSMSSRRWPHYSCNKLCFVQCDDFIKNTQILPNGEKRKGKKWLLQCWCRFILFQFIIKNIIWT